MERRHFLKLAFGLAAGAAALAASAQAAPLMPQPPDGLLPNNPDAHPAVTSGDEVERLQPQEVRWAGIVAGAIAATGAGTAVVIGVGVAGTGAGAAGIGAGIVAAGAAVTGKAHPQIAATSRNNKKSPAQAGLFAVRYRSDQTGRQRPYAKT